MKVVGVFLKKDGSVTPTMTTEEIRQGKYKEYGVTDQDLKLMCFRYFKTLIEGNYPGVKIELKQVKKSA